VTTEGAAQSAVGTCTDHAGNTASDTQTGINIDKTAPEIAFTGRTAPNANGWNNTDVTVNWSCADAGGSGVVDAAVSQLLAAEGANQSATGTCSDLAGNTAGDTQTSINIDKTAPTIIVNGPLSGSFTVCSIPARPTYSAADQAGLSGLDGSEGDSWSTPAGLVGTYTYSAHAADLAGNTASATRTYTVIYGTAFGGVLQPINADGSSRIKLGSTVPVKFQLTCGTTPFSNAVVKLTVNQGDTVPDPGVDEAVSTAASTTGNAFRYDATAKQYIFNLSTKNGYLNPGGTTPIAFAQGTWTLGINLDDGTSRTIKIQLVK
jgi:hypothetical protein